MLNVLPRDERYFERFSDMARRIHESARILDIFFRGESPVATVADQIKRLEHECDEISHEILRGIDRTFITPIDREDIHQLAVRLDDVIDLIDGTVRRMSLFKITEPTPASRALSATIVEITAEMVKAVSALSLFANEMPAVELIKWKDIYENMEGCIDQCEAVAHVLESVVLKHS
jgi:uncharacterized protein Yka (UPF0111/DUF47 family)